MRNDELSDQLKIWKLVEKKQGVSKTTGTRTELVLALQPLIAERFGTDANDLEPGDDGLWGQGLRRRRTEGQGGGKKQRKGKKWVVQGEWEWDSTMEFIIERLIGKMVADGKAEVPGRGVLKAGTVLYRVLWEGWPEELATWEEEEDIPCGEVDFVAQYDAVLESTGSSESGGGASEDEDEDEVYMGRSHRDFSISNACRLVLEWPSVSHRTLIPSLNHSVGPKLRWSFSAAPRVRSWVELPFELSPESRPVEWLLATR